MKVVVSASEKPICLVRYAGVGDVFMLAADANVVTPMWYMAISGTEIEMDNAAVLRLSDACVVRLALNMVIIKASDAEIHITE